MKRDSSCTSLHLLDTPDFDSCCSDSDVFEPPAAWRPGRFLQFADIITTEEEPAVRPVSLTTELLGHHGLCSVSLSDSQGSLSGSNPLSIQIDDGQSRPAALCKLTSRRTTLLVTSCMAVALTALTLLSFVL